MSTFKNLSENSRHSLKSAENGQYVLTFPLTFTTGTLSGTRDITYASPGSGVYTMTFLGQKPLEIHYGACQLHVAAELLTDFLSYTSYVSSTGVITMTNVVMAAGTVYVAADATTSGANAMFVCSGVADV